MGKLTRSPQPHDFAPSSASRLVITWWWSKLSGGSADLCGLAGAGMLWCWLILLGGLVAGGASAVMGEEAGRLSQLFERLEGHIVHRSIQMPLATFFADIFVPEVENLYSRLIMRLFAQDSVDLEENQQCSEIISAGITNCQEAILESCDASTTDGLIYYVRAHLGRLQVEKIARDILAIESIPRIANKLTLGQAEALHRALIAKRKLLVQISEISLLDPDGWSVPLGVPPPLHGGMRAQEAISRLLSPLEDEYYESIQHLVGLVDSFQQVEDGAVFEQIYTLLLKGWEIAFRLPKECSGLFEQMIFDSHQQLVILTKALVSKTLISAADFRPDTSTASSPQEPTSQSQRPLRRQLTRAASRLLLRTASQLAHGGRPVRGDEGEDDEEASGAQENANVLACRQLLNLGFANRYRLTPSKLGYYLDQIGPSFERGREHVLRFRHLLDTEPESMCGILRDMIRTYNCVLYALRVTSSGAKHALCHQRLFNVGRHLFLYIELVKERLDANRLQTLQLPGFIDGDDPSRETIKDSKKFLFRGKDRPPPA